jgi:septum formation protein
MIILASTSPRRKQLLEQLGLPFTVVPSNVVEELNSHYPLEKQAEFLSLQKAQAVAAQYEDAIIIGADTIILFENELIGKPKDKKDAKKLLAKFSGKSHVIITGFTILDAKTKKTITKSVKTKIWFRELEESEIDSYIEKEKPFDKAGAYALQDLGAIFIEKIEGDFFGGVGLPLFTLAKELKHFGVTIL